MRPTRDPASLKPGDALPAWEKTFRTPDLVAYGAATWDWHRLHYDLEYARAANLPNVVIDGQAYGALFARHALDWLGPRAFIRHLSFRMRAMAFAGDTLRAEGEVREVRREAEGAVVALSQRLSVGDRLVAEATIEARLAG
jgi:acyl dehydratase